MPESEVDRWRGPAGRRNAPHGPDACTEHPRYRVIHADRECFARSAFFCGAATACARSLTEGWAGLGMACFGEIFHGPHEYGDLASVSWLEAPSGPDPVSGMWRTCCRWPCPVLGRH